MGSIYALPSSDLSTSLFYGLQVWISAGPLKDVQRPVPKPRQHLLSCVLWVLGMLKGEIFPHSEDLCSLEQDFFKDLSIFRSIYPFPNSDHFPRLFHGGNEKHGQSSAASLVRMVLASTFISSTLFCQV